MNIKQGYLKIIECFDVSGMGLITEIQHNENGIPPKSQIFDETTGESWEVKKRIFNGLLLISNNEILFDCETEVTHVSSNFKNDRDRENQIVLEMKRRENGIYWYLLNPTIRNSNLKPSVGKIMRIKETTP